MDIYTLADLITKALTINLMVSIVIYGYFFLTKQRLNTLLCLYVLGCLVFDASSYLLGKYLGYNHFLIPLFGLFEFVIWHHFFLTKEKRKAYQYRAILAFYMGIIGIEILFLFFEASFLPIPSRSLGYALLLFNLKKFSLTATYQQLKKYKWLLPCVLFYISFSCIYYLLLTFSVYWNNNLKFILWLLHSTLLHLFYIAITYYQLNPGKIR